MTDTEAVCRSHLQAVRRHAITVLDLSERSLDALDAAKGLDGNVHGVTCAELVKQYAIVSASSASVVKASMDWVAAKLQERSGGLTRADPQRD